MIMIMIINQPINQIKFILHMFMLQVNQEVHTGES